MSSPTETPQAIANSTSDKESGDLVIGGVRVPLPRWARFVIGILALAGTGLSLLVTLTSVGRTTQASPPSQPPVKVDSYREYQRHITESPEYTQTVFADDKDLGSLVVKFYKSDGCLLVTRKNPGRYDVNIPYWVPAATIEAEKPPGSTGAPASRLEQVLGSGYMAAQIQPPTLAVAHAATALPAGNCWDPHAGEFRWWNGQQNGCWLQIFRAWPDGCQHYQWFNSCNGYWDSNPNGSPRVYWTNCNH